MKKYFHCINVAVLSLLAGCQLPGALIATSVGAMPGEQHVPKDYPTPPQRVYAIDENRFFTFEKYESCIRNGQVFYNDTKQNIRTEITNFALGGYAGKFHHTASTDKPIAFPYTPAPRSGSCRKLCSLMILYSTDGGRTFDRFHPRDLSMDYKKSHEKSKGMTVVLTEEKLFVTDGRQAASWKFDSDGGPIFQKVLSGPSDIPLVQTPSGQDCISCDNSIQVTEKTTKAIMHKNHYCLPLRVICLSSAAACYQSFWR
ncbi:hypothetical protein EDC30_106218 [Paucimonas lemoignei]|uniref:Tli3-like domain-containing protein n=1 Tax=Paucimonas lemoignei TaxID=29443 RepID=A0A4R3HWZ2_PAULE|nr:hypothetical protein [Paucimonas lemoignei]TCS36675.1 hypothetical protein EDC30_106218 [Paucimonas lemoignei]